MFTFVQRYFQQILRPNDKKKINRPEDYYGKSTPNPNFSPISIILLKLTLRTLKNAENGAYPPNQNGLIHPQLSLKWA